MIAFSKLKKNSKIIIESEIIHIPEVLNVHINEIYKKLTKIKLNKFKLKKVFKKITFSFSKVNFLLLEKRIFLRKVDFLIIFVHMNVQNFRHMNNSYVFGQIENQFWLRKSWVTGFFVDQFFFTHFLIAFGINDMSNQCSYHLPNSWFFSYFYYIGKCSKYSVNFTFSWECNDTPSLSKSLRSRWRCVLMTSVKYLNTFHYTRLIVFLPFLNLCWQCQRHTIRRDWSVCGCFCVFFNILRVNLHLAIYWTSSSFWWAWNIPRDNQFLTMNLQTTHMHRSKFSSSVSHFSVFVLNIDIIQNNDEAVPTASLEGPNTF